MRRARAVLAALCLACAPALAAPAVRMEGGLAPDEHQAATELLQAGLARLPSRWARALPDPLHVRWRDDLPPGVHGRARGGRIALDRRLLRAWMARPPGAGPGHPAVRAALAALLHELAHVYDRGADGGLSRDPRLLDLAGWQVAALRPGRRARNFMADRSPDPYELHSPREFVAVNLEHYLLDPEYGCRRPALRAHFDAWFRRPAAATACAPELPFVQDAADAAEPLRLLDPERVYAVDYLLAEGNARPMSRWGHSMLRLVVCAPGRPRGPDCRLDLQHHLVLSFRAFVDDVQISSWRGLTGAYPARLFALPLGQVVDEYTKVELRGLRSVPLALERGEVAALLARAAQLHWSYDGRYYFLANNCAVETWRLLHDAVPRLAALPLSSITPTGLLRRLRRAGATDEAAVPADPASQVRLGYYFEPASAHYQAMYEVARQALDLAPADVQGWLELPPQARRPALERAGLRPAAALLLLEAAALRREEALARDALKRLLLRPERLPVAAGTHEALRRFLELGGRFARPAAWLEGQPGYGLPQEDERATLAARVAADAALRGEQGRRLQARARALLPPARQAALAATEANLELAGRRLRALARQPRP
ncbi:MAG: DUF4105 domain-containing protein [Lysobacteraceae bacterium]|jgi:Uncharacterized protein conserved in bacteria|nr:hypothetical protein [Xanthomonadaceae bacterium]